MTPNVPFYPRAEIAKQLKTKNKEGRLNYLNNRDTNKYAQVSVRKMPSRFHHTEVQGASVFLQLSPSKSFSLPTNFRM